MAQFRLIFQNDPVLGLRCDFDASDGDQGVLFPIAVLLVGFLIELIDEIQHLEDLVPSGGQPVLDQFRIRRIRIPQNQTESQHIPQPFVHCFGREIGFQLPNFSWISNAVGQMSEDNRRPFSFQQIFRHGRRPDKI